MSGTRATNVKTPGVAAAPTADDDVERDIAANAAADASTGDTGEDAPATPASLPPDLQALVAAEVARALAANKPVNTQASESLPSEKQAIKQVKTSGRAVLSEAGYVCIDPKDAKVNRDVNGFAKE